MHWMLANEFSLVPKVLFGGTIGAIQKSVCRSLICSCHPRALGVRQGN